MLFYGKRVSARLSDFQYGAAVFYALIFEARPAYFGTELKRNAHGAVGVNGFQRKYRRIGRADVFHFYSAPDRIAADGQRIEQRLRRNFVRFVSADVGDMPPKYSDIIISGPHDQP